MGTVWDADETASNTKWNNFFCRPNKPFVVRRTQKRFPIEAGKI